MEYSSFFGHFNRFNKKKVIQLKIKRFAAIENIVLVLKFFKSTQAK